jgi:MFS family permease
MDSSTTSASPRQRAALMFIFITVMLDMLAFGIIIPVLPQLIVQLLGGSIARAAAWSGAFGALYMLMQFVFSPVQGALSDRHGRRAVILISSLGLGIDFIVMALAPVLWVLFVGRAISGICSASFPPPTRISPISLPRKNAPLLSARWAPLSASVSSSVRRWAAFSVICICVCRSGWRPVCHC